MPSKKKKRQINEGNPTSDFLQNLFSSLVPFKKLLAETEARAM